MDPELYARALLERLAVTGVPDVRHIAAGDPSKDIGGGKARVIQKIANIPCTDAEISEAVEKVGAIAGSGPSRDVVDIAGLSDGGAEITCAGCRSDARTHLRIAN